METSSQLSTNALKKFTVFEMHYSGVCIDKIAKAIDANPKTVASYLSREWKKDYTLFRQEQNGVLILTARAAIVQALKKANEVLVDALDHPNPKIRLTAALAILDRSLPKGKDNPIESVPVPILPYTINVEGNASNQGGAALQYHP